MSVSDAKDDAKLPTAERCMQGEVICAFVCAVMSLRLNNVVAVLVRKVISALTISLFGIML